MKMKIFYNKVKTEVSEMAEITRRDFFKLAGVTAAAAAAGNFGITEAAKRKTVKIVRQAPVVGSKLVESGAIG